MMVKRNVPLPDFAPVTKRVGLTDDIANLNIGDSGVVQYKASVVRQACKRVIMALGEAGVPDIHTYVYAVWPSNSDGSAAETGEDFALVARITTEQAAKYEQQRPGSTITARNMSEKEDKAA